MTTEHDNLQISSIILCFMSWLFSIILSYYTYKFYKLRHEMIMIKRRAKIVICYSLCAIMILLWGYPIHIVYWGSQSNSVAFNIIDDLLLNPLIYIYAFFVASRIWLIFYDISFSNSIINVKWKKIINSNIQELKTEQWYTSNRATLGNQLWVLQRSIATALTISFFSLITIYLYDFDIINVPLWYIINGIVFPLIIGCMIHLSRKIADLNTFSDSIHLSWEARLISYTFIAGFILYAISVIIQLIVPLIFFEALSFFAGLSMAFLVPYFSTFCVLKKLKLNDPEMIKKQSQSVGIELLSNELPIQDVLKDENLFDLFMQHLISEFCMEVCCISNIYNILDITK